MADQVTTTFRRDSEKKNSVKYDGKWGAFYIPKTALAEIGNPDEIEVTLKPAG
jgi:hypothetical protein